VTEAVRFHFDPVCPWCYQTSRWLKRVAELGQVTLSWGLFSLELQNAGSEPESLATVHARSRLALATAVAVRDEAGSDGVGAFYGAIGERVHERGGPLHDPATVEAACERLDSMPRWRNARRLTTPTRTALPRSIGSSSSRRGVSVCQRSCWTPAEVQPSSGRCSVSRRYRRRGARVVRSCCLARPL
jgi:hypothetical protein